MDIQELETYDLSKAVQFHDRLNPRIWDDREQMLPEVRERLLAIAADFQEFLGVPDLDLQDITISGSNAAYSYTPHSDIDLHLVVKMPADPIYAELFNAKKYQYNDEHNIRIGGADVELYVQDAAQPHVSQGIYSVQDGGWLSVPRRRAADVDDDSVRHKYEDLGQRIEQVIDSGDADAMATMIERVKDLRKSGLARNGEFGAENLAFKLLRQQGLIQRLYDARTAAEDQRMSLEERRRKKSSRSRARSGVFPWFSYYGTGAVDSGEGGDGGGGESIREGRGDQDRLAKFVAFVAGKLGLERVPSIHVHQDPEWSRANGTFGMYDVDTGELHVSLAGRHPMDVMRTIAHELTHRRQDQDDALHDAAGETGSPQEDEANAEAGRLMRVWAQTNPEMFDTVDEDYSPDDPPGPESKPTMPAGTVRVDVSDMYDWYKLGQHISNMKGLGQHDFGQGPPSSILSFGDEDLEHRYIQDLQRTGLDTTDIDPAAHDPRAGQKTDPTYNVKEASGYIPTRRQARDPRFRMALTRDVQPGETGRQANKLGLKTDSQGHPELLMQDLRNLLESIKAGDEELREVDMSPGALERWAQSDAAQKVRVGFEFEMYFPDTAGGEDNNDYEDDGDGPQGPNDQRTSDIEGIIQFFRDGPDPPAPHQLRLVREQLEKEYREWRDDVIDTDMHEGNFYRFMTDSDAVEKQREKLTKQYREQAQEILGPDADDAAVEDDVQNLWQNWVDQQWNKGAARYMKAFRRWTEARQDDEGIGSETDWLDRWGSDYVYMSDVASTFGLLWPYRRADKKDSGKVNARKADDWAREISDVIGMPVRTGGYHGTSRGKDFANLEPDSSLDKPRQKSDAGLELITPYRPLPEALEILNRVTRFAREKGIYTNDSTGLHMNVSLADVPNVDWVKLVLFMGDQYVLDQFERQANYYAASSLGKLMDRVRKRQTNTTEAVEDQAIYDEPMDVNRAIELMRGNMIQLARQAVQSGLGKDKYQSVHVKPLSGGNSYIEFRGPGNDWLGRQSTVRRRVKPGFTGPPRPVDILQDTVFRLGRAMTIAADPAAEREEYARKLYRVLTPENPNLRDPIRMFARYNAGEITQQQLKRDWADTVLRAQNTPADDEVPAKQQRRQSLAQRFTDKDTWWRVSMRDPDADYASQGIPGWIRAGTAGQAIEKFRERNKAAQNFSASEMTAEINEPRPLDNTPPPPQTVRDRTFYQGWGQSGHNWAMVVQNGDVWDSFPAPTAAAAQDRLRSYQNERPGEAVWLVPLEPEPDREGKPGWRLTWTIRRGIKPANLIVQADSARQALDLVKMRDASARRARDMRVEPYEPPAYQPPAAEPASSTVMGPPRQNINHDPYANYAIVHVRDNRVVLPFRRDNDREAMEFYQEWVKERMNPRGYQLVPFLPPVGWRDPNLTESQELTEVKMSPSALRQFLASPEAAGIRAGFEAEMVFRDAQGDGDDDDQGGYDYDQDQRARTIDEVIEFFEGGENGISPSRARRLRDDMQEQYLDWVRDSFVDNYFTESRFMEWVEENIWPEVDDTYREQARDALGDDDITDEELEKQALELFREDAERDYRRSGEWYDRADEELYEDYLGDVDEAEWLSENGYRFMTDVADAWNIDWPYFTESSNTGGRDWADIGASLEGITGMPVDVGTGYHSKRRRPGHYVLEPDSSIDSDDSTDFGLEIVSPPLPLPEALEQLRRVIDWANGAGNAYTNTSTGLHMGVSLPYKGGEVDPIKLILFMGDRNILETFGRESNTYARSAMERLQTKVSDMRNAGPKQISGIMDLMKKNLIELADRDLRRGVLSNKYISVNPHDGYIEFRGPGGDYLAKSDEIDDVLENTMLRLAYAMNIAGRPDLYRDEYAKKLYKVLTGYRATEISKGPKDTRYQTRVESEDDSPFMRLFSDYSAGTLSGQELKTQWAKAVLDMERQSDDRDTIQTEPSAPEPRSKTGARRAEKARKILDRPLVWHVEDTNDGRVILVQATDKDSAYREARRIDPGFNFMYLNDPDSFLVQPATAAETQQYLQQQADDFADSQELQARLGAAPGARSDPNALAPGEQDWLVRWSEYRTETGSANDGTTQTRERQVNDSLRTVARTAAEASQRLIDSLRAQGRQPFNVTAEPTDPPPWRAPQPLPIPGSTLDIQRQRQQAAQQGQELEGGAPGARIVNDPRQSQGEFTGRWLVRDPDTGQNLTALIGLGNVQADANRVAAAWVARNRPDLAGSDIEVVPEMR